MNASIRFIRRLLAITLICLIPLLGNADLARATTSVFINEIHYDNAGIDAGEAVEIAGPAGTDLTGWTLVLYNGSGGASYTTTALSGILADQQAGYGTISFSYPSNGIQNGSPDGLALVDPSSNVIQFLSYEGVFTATNGPALGILSTNIGVVEGSLTPLGFSLQLGGSGTVYEDFAWQTELAHTFGAVNTGQTFEGGPVIPDLVINEIDYDQPGTDAAEFIEIKNVGASPADLTGVTLELVNGSGGGAVVYSTIALPSASLAAGDYFVVCANTATVANCDLDVAPDANLIQNGAPDGAGLRFAGSLLDAVSYEGNTGAPYTEGSGAGLEDNGASAGIGISRCDDGVDTDQNNVDLISAGGTPGEENACGLEFGACFDAATRIYDIQSAGPASPLVGQIHNIEGVVVGDFQSTSTGLSGFFLQEEDTQTDANPLTSDGIFVFDSGFGVDVLPGDIVRVQGTVTEFFNLTELNSVTDVAVCGPGAAGAALISLPVAAVTDLEAFEGMAVHIEQELTVSEVFTLGRFGEALLSVNGRLFIPTHLTTPGPAALLQQDLNDRSSIQLDDGSLVQNPLPLPPYLGPDNTRRVGSTLPALSGVLSYAFGAYEIHPVGPLSFSDSNPRSAAPDPVGGTLTVASFNVLNYFTTLDTGAQICGPGGNLGCRGANSALEFDRQRTKIITALLAIDADIVGLMEVENNPSAAIQDLVDGLNAIAGAGTYDFIDTGTIGTDAIKVALIYKPAAVTPLGAYAILDSTVDPDFLDTKNRPTLAQSFQANADGAVFTVAVNHLKSKGSSCADVGDPDAGDGQGNCNGTRTAAAQALVDWLATDPTGSGDPDFLIIGDLNSYAMEDPITAISDAGYTNLIASLIGAGAYSFVFDGQSGYLDHALANASLAGQVSGVAEWHINADEPIALDYNTEFNQPLLYDPGPYRASDHDPIVVGLDLNAAPVCSGASPSVASLWPVTHRMAAVGIEGVFDPDGDAFTLVIDAIWQDEPLVGGGSGFTSPDGGGIGSDTALLRVERAGVGDGRVYHVFFTASDGYGNSCSGEVTVSVPFSQGIPAVDGGALYDSTGGP